MPRLEWDKVGTRKFQTGVDHGVLYPQKNGEYPLGVAWSGLINITVSTTGAEDNPQYADNMKYLNLKSAEEVGATITCFYYPDEWRECNGEGELADGVLLGQQRRNTFGLCFRTKIGNDTEGEDYGYILHILYGCSSAPSEQSFGTTNDSPEAVELSYEVTTTPIPVSGTSLDGKPYRPVAHVMIDSTRTDPEKLKTIEALLYGTDATEAAEGDSTTGTNARLPIPDELANIMAAG